MSGGSPSTQQSAEAADDRLSLADWRRRIADLYGDVRSIAAIDPVAAWERWREVRQQLFREHPQSPVPQSERAAFEAHHWPYDPGLRFELAVIDDKAPSGAAAPGTTPATPGSTPATPGSTPATPGSRPAASSPGGLGLDFGAGFGTLLLPVSTGGEQSFTRIGWLDVPFAAGTRRLGVYWMAGYAGGLFLPFRDATNGDRTYGAGRYLLDAAKSADLGGDMARRTLVLDFNFAFHPSCAFDPKWSCPLSPIENRLDIPVEAGERLH